MNRTQLDEIKAILRRQQVEMEDDVLISFIDAVERSRLHFSRSQELALYVALLQKREEEPERKTVVLVSSLQEVDSYPAIISFGVLSADWPGLSDSCIGVIHERGWNLYFNSSFVVRHKTGQLGIIVMAIEVDSPEAKKRLGKELPEIVENLEKTGVGSLAKSYLLAQETRRLEIYARVIEQIEALCPEEELESLIGRDGEAVKFFGSRSESYIAERKIEDLAEQITTNYFFMRKIRESGGRVQIKIRNLKTCRERLTGITVAGFARDLVLGDYLETLGHVVPGFKIMFNKEFTTDDGIAFYRLEITNEVGNSFTYQVSRRIKKALSEMAATKRLERARRIETLGGFEHYARAIIPFLLHEFQKFGQAQVYISVGQTTDHYADFKLIIIVSRDRSSRDRVIFKCIEALESVPGLSVLSAKPPKTYGTGELDIADIRADLDAFSDSEAVYGTIRKIVREVIGDFRDFDEGMRRMDMKKLSDVRERLKGIRKDLVREFYYCLEDFYRASAQADEIARQIRLGVGVLRQLKRSGDDMVVKGKDLFISTDLGRKVPITTLVAIAYPTRRGTFRKCLDALEGYEVTISRVEVGETTVLLCRVMEGLRPLSPEKFKELLKRLKKQGCEVPR